MIAGISDADLTASVDLLAFMWAATGNDPRAITPQLAQLLRMQLAQNLWQLPVPLQALFANARENFTTIQTLWDAATPDRRLVIVGEFQQLLSLLGLASEAGRAAFQENSYNADIASNIAWHASGAGDWSAR